MQELFDNQSENSIQEKYVFLYQKKIYHDLDDRRRSKSNAMTFSQGSKRENSQRWIQRIAFDKKEEFFANRLGCYSRTHALAAHSLRYTISFFGRHSRSDYSSFIDRIHYNIIYLPRKQDGESYRSFERSFKSKSFSYQKWRANKNPWKRSRKG